MSAIEIRGLVKEFGATRAVDGLNLSVPKGAVFGFLGPNGAGKTTTLRILTGLAAPSEGSVSILGVDVTKNYEQISPRIGYLPENPAFYGWMTAVEYLSFCADLFSLSKEDRDRRVGYILDVVGLSDINRPILGYSKGMKQRLGVAQALINGGDVLFLDEPTSALDPVGRKEVLDMIATLAKEKTVFFSTHILSDVERVCDQVAMLNKGKLVIESDLQTLKEQYLEPVFTLEFDDLPGLFVSLLSGLPWVVKVEISEKTVIVRVNDLELAQRELPRLVARTSLPLRNYQLAEPSLEDIFMRVLS